MYRSEMKFKEFKLNIVNVGADAWYTVRELGIN